jgi:hypothetical protein
MHRWTLRVLPLLLVVAGALHAGAIFGPPSGTVSAIGGGIATGTAGGLTTFGGQGISLDGTGTLTGVKSGRAGLLFDWTGTGSGTFLTDTLPASWDFTITGPGASTSDWTLTFTINPGSTTTILVITTYTGSVGAGGGSVSVADAPINALTGNDFVSYEVSLEVDTAFTSSTETLAVDVPPLTSIDINPADVPEPASILLGAIGITALCSVKIFRRPR